MRVWAERAATVPELRVCVALLTLLAFCTLPGNTAAAQAIPSRESGADIEANAGSLGPSTIAPPAHGFNLSLISAAQHDSVTGWSQVLTPALSLGLKRGFSVDASTPFFTYLQTERTKKVAGVSTTQLAVRRNVLSDTVASMHWAAPSIQSAWLGDLQDTPTLSLVAPTGSVQDGLSTGKFAYNVSNHLESSIALSPYIDLGIGTSSLANNRRVKKAQSTSGLLGNAAVGLTVPLHGQLGVSIEGYEALPLGNQTAYQTVTRKRRPLKQAAGKSIGEDNGVNASLDLPVRSRFTVSAFYSRSLRQHEDSAGMSFTCSLRERPSE